MSSNPNGFIPPHGGYQNLMSYQMAEIVYDATVYFCDKYISKFSRTHDQMVQAAVLEQLDVSNMSNGMHLFNLRAKDERGYYSSIVSQFFYKKELTNSDTNHLVSYEYWFDDDFQNKTVVDISPAEQSTVLAQLDVSTMSNGMHLFNFRAKDERGYYSSIAYPFFFQKNSNKFRY